MTIRQIASIAFLLLTLIGAVHSQRITSAVTANLLDTEVKEFQVTDSSFTQAVSALSRLPIKDLHLGFEEVLRDKTSDPPKPGTHFTISPDKSTLREILDLLCEFDSRYTWARDGETINIYPKEVAEDSSYLLNRWLQQITVTELPDPGEGLTFLDRQLPPPREQLAYAGAGGNFSYASPWTQSFSQLTVRQFINRLSEHMGSHTSWVFYGSKEERRFTFLKGGFN